MKKKLQDAIKRKVVNNLMERKASLKEAFKIAQTYINRSK
tara:strand:- start:226 stop:345 length:120 start_codon:yes stop_codon:yes gene_type:complete